MSEIFKIILSFFHNRNEGKMFVHPVTHDAHGLALKKMCLGTSSRSIFYVTGKQFPVTKKQMTDTVSSVTRFVFIHCVVKTLALAMGI